MRWPGLRRILGDLSARYVRHPLPGWVGTVLSCIVSASAIVRGLDLLTVPPPTRASSVNAYVDILGTYWWGHAILGTGLLLAAGVLTSRVGLLLLGHAAGVGVYLGYTVALAQGVVASDGPGGGWRFVASAAATLAIHVLSSVLLISDMKTLGRARA